MKRNLKKAMEVMANLDQETQDKIYALAKEIKTKHEKV